MVGEKRTTALRRRRGSTPTTGELEMASTSGLDDQGDLEDGLAVGLVEAGKAPAGVDGLELGGGDGLGLAVGAGVGRAVEAAQLVVEGPGEAAAQRARTRAPARAGAEDHLLELVVEGHGARHDGAVAVRTSTSLTASSAALSTISLHRLVDLDVDGHRAREGGRRDVRARSRCGMSPARPSGAAGTPRSLRDVQTWDGGIR